jgi:HEAT repeat protein
LRRIGDQSAAPRVLPLLAEDTLREAALETLGEIGTEEALAPIMTLLNEDESASPVAALALGALLERCVRDSANRDAPLERARAAITESGKANLRASLASANENERRALVRLAGWFADRRLGEALVELVLENENLREEAARALVNHGAAAVDLLLEKLEGATNEARPAMIRALGEIGDERAFEPLVELLKDSGAATRRAAVEALKALGHPETIRNLCGLLTDDEPATREAALRVVGFFGAEGCEDYIYECIRDADERVRCAAIEQLPVINDERAVAELIRALQGDSPRGREAAAKALAQVRSEISVAALREALADEDSWTRYFAVRALGALLGALNDGASRRKLSELAEQDAAEHVRAAAREVLDGLKL